MTKERDRHFAIGDIVLLRLPGFARKLESAWDGPHEIDGKFNEVNYECCIPSWRNQVKVFHVNYIKIDVEEQTWVL